MKKSRLAVLLVIVLVTIFTIVGCGKAENQISKEAAQQQADESKLNGTVKLAGATSVQPLAEELATVFMEKNPGISVIVQGGGSSAGVQFVNTGAAQIGTTSRELKAEEKGYGLKENVIAKDGITVIVNTKNQIMDLNDEQIEKIFSGEIKDWSEVGGGKSPITVVIREEGSSTRDVFEDIILDDGNFSASTAVHDSTEGVKSAVGQDENAIGFISLSSIDVSVKALKVNGVEPSEANVIDGLYKISRPILFLTKAESDAATKAFIEFVLSSEGQTIVAKEFVKVK